MAKKNKKNVGVTSLFSSFITLILKYYLTLHTIRVFTLVTKAQKAPQKGNEPSEVL